MKKFIDLLKENYGYDQRIDGPPLTPNTLNSAENQILTLARNIRTTFKLDDRWNDHHFHLDQAIKLLEDAAQIISKIPAEDRNIPHKFNR